MVRVCGLGHPCLFVARCCGVRKYKDIKDAVKTRLLDIQHVHAALIVEAL